MHAHRSALCACLLLLVALWLPPRSAPAATFTNNASIKADDPNTALTSTSGVFTVSCWFRVTVPSSFTLSEHMLILMDRSDGNESANHSFQLRLNGTTADVEFQTRGSGGTFTKTIIQRPYLERWYHVAVARSGSTFSTYVDGQLVLGTPESGTTAVGTTTGSGLAIGGVNGSSKLFYGDIIEAAIYSASLPQSLIQDRMFKDQRSFANLRGYYRLGYSTDAADFYRNFVPTPPPGTQPAVKLGSGNIDFEETDQAGEQSIFDSRKNKGANEVAPLSGAFVWSQTALARPTPGITFEFRFGYANTMPTTPPTDGNPDPYDRRVLGPGWRHIFDSRVVSDASLKEFKLFTWEGGFETWTRTNLFTPFKTRHGEYRGELFQIGSAEVEWTTPQRLVYKFRDPTDGTVMAGRLIEIRDFNSNRVRLFWNEDEALLTNVVDSAGGSYAFHYDPSRGLLTNVLFGEWSVSFSYDQTNRLSAKSFSGPSAYTSVNTTWQFFYNPTNGFLDRIVDPRGNTNISVVFDRYGRKIQERDALSRSNRIEYGVPGKRQIRTTDADGQPWIETFDRKHRLLARRDPLGNETQFTYDDAGNPMSITEPLGWKTFMAYDSRGNVIATTSALGEVSRRVIHPFFNKGVQEIDPLGWTNFIVIDDATGNLLRNYDALGDLSRYTYTTNGLVQTAIDGNGRTNRVTYDTNGFPIARTDAAGFTMTSGYNELGWKLADTNALGEMMTFAYDINGNVVRATDALSRTITKTYDPNGNVLSASDAKGQFSFSSYDAANQRTQMVDRIGNVSRSTYTLRGQVERSIDPLGFASTNFYDAANRPVAASDALGNTVSNIYDPHGKIIAMIDQVGQRWTKTYDRLNRVFAETDPQGDTRQTTYDPVNRVKVITTPKGYPSTHEYDGRGRLTKWVDAENYQWLYDYDGLQNITNITDALGGHYVMAYGPRNERTLERNQDGFEWRYTYDELLRLKTQTDPNGTTRTLDYDGGGRVLSVSFNTGRVNFFQYDENNNPELLFRSGSGPPTLTSFRYDALDRVTESTDAFSKKVKFGYDSRGLRATLTYPDNKVLTNRFDAIGRLTNQIDWAGRQMSYAFDKAGRLIRRTYPNGIVQTNTFDEAGQLTGLNYAPSTLNSNALNIALTYAYDRNGNKSSGTEKGTLQWPMPSLADEKARYTPSNRLIDRQITPLDPLNSQPSTLNYSFDPSGNMTNAVGNGQSWHLTYDEDNRTTSILWDAGITSKLITNRYDALGRRVARTLDGATTSYALDLGGGMERILCDMTAAGAITAWYVHGPDLAYKVDTANNVTCFHADAMANIIALSDGSANTTALYAYTPYGRSLGSTNQQFQISNPYLFVGSQGVMEELPGLYFMRARYYSAEAAVFLSTDPVKPIGPGWNAQVYAYADGNPLRNADPNGLFSTSDVLGVFDKAEKGSEVFENLMEVFSNNDWDNPQTRATVVGAFNKSYGSFVASFMPGGSEAVGAMQGQLPYDDILSLADETAQHLASGFQKASKIQIRFDSRDPNGFGPLGPRGPDFSLDQVNKIVGEGFKKSALAESRAAARSSRALREGKPALGNSSPPTASRSPLAPKTARAVKHAEAVNAKTVTIPKFASAAINIGAAFVGSLVADAFGRILPRSTPPVVRIAAQFAVAAVTTAVVSKVATAIVAAIIGVPKGHIFVMVLIVALAVITGWRHGRQPRSMPLLWWLVRRTRKS